MTLHSMILHVIQKFTKNKLGLLALFCILIIASFFRFYNLNWDQNQHLHPDERFLTMVTNDITWPTSVSEYLDPQRSPLNPRSKGYDFFVYGTIPLYITKIVSSFLVFDTFNYNNITLVGRFISAFLDVGVVLLMYAIGKKLYNKKVGLWAAFIYSLFVLPIQLSHFYAVDTFLNFFLVLSFY